MTTEPWNRRRFLRRLGAAGLGAPVIGWVGCGDRSQAESGTSTTGGGRTGLDPIVRAYAGDAVAVVAPMSEPPIAYVSQGRRLVFIDRDFRDLLVGILSAHISVSTGHWRIPQPGDPLEEPLIPGVPLREFEEVAIGDLDPEMEPSEGDFRIRHGQRTETTIDFPCVPILDSSRRFSGGPWRLEQCDGSSAGTCREDFVEVGVGTRSAAMDCGDGAEEMRILTWVCPEA